MSKEGTRRNYIWLLHIAIWVVLFGMPFFSPRPGHPLHGGVDYSRFIPTYISFIIIFYVNYFYLIRKYLYDRRIGLFLLWNALLVATVSVLIHLAYKYAIPIPSQELHPEPPMMPEPGPGPGPGNGFGHGPGHGPRPPLPQKEMLDQLSFIPRNLLVYAGIVCVAVAVRMTERWYMDERKRQEMEKATTEAELAALKSQVNPHFLFNTLNNIYSLIQIDQDRAQEAVHDLSGLMRHVLYDSEQPTVTLGSESAFIQDYIRLMSMRCPGNLKLEVNLPRTDSDRKIAPMLFLPLVENAFKHGISDSGESFIKIDIREDGPSVSCLVENSDYPKGDTDRSGSGIGIKNLCRRLEMLYPGKHSFEYGKVRDFYRCLLKVDTES